MAGNKNIKINLDYSQFSGGIQDCQRKMGLLTEQFKMQKSALGNNASEVDKLRLSQSSLSDQVALQIQIVEKASAKYEALASSEGATATQVDKAQKAYIQQVTKLNELSNKLEEVNDRLEETSQSEEEMGESTNTAASQQQNLAANISATVAVVATFVSALKQVGDAIVGLATRSTEWADNLSTTAAQIGVTTTTLQELAYASSFVDVSVETMQGSMSKLTKVMSDAQNGSQTAQSAFNTLGVSIETTGGGLKSSEQVFYEVIDALGEIDNATERDAAAMAIFGKSAQELNTLIEAGSGTLQAYGEEAKAMGLVMSEDDVAALAKMQDSFDKLDAAIEGAQNRVSAAFAPAISALAEGLSEADPIVLDVVAGIGGLITVVTTLTPLLQAGAAITQMWTLAKGASAAATVVETGAEVGLGAAAMATNAALLPQIALIVALAATIATLVYAIKGLVDAFKMYAEAADKASASTQKFADSASGVGSSDSSSSSSGRRHYALGGRVSGGRVWVGEQGAELVDLPGGSTVYNHQESSNMTSSNNVFNITIDAKSVDEFNKVVNVFSGLSQSMNRGGRVNG